MAPKARPCAVCATISTQRCSRCASTHYCSLEHQNQDWPTHKRICHKSDSEQTHEAKKNPKHSKVNAILFPAVEVKPRLIRVEYEEVTDSESGVTFHRTKTDDYIGSDLPERSWIISDGFHGPPLKGNMSIELVYRERFLADGSPLNQSIVALTGGKNAHPWCGNILALKKTADGDKVVDISVKEDFPALVKYFVEYGTI
ncbi:hypothetical protein BD410DRAFT_794798 [Rickenella mellea]|uniref:MYND-type domain-containing protein n=1 Tax=Rickenella mellea TaxID=50990 RepID=A0A4Y7PR39_9AGAM|nr:hypothetical protein BD410DRAFT_794798 [Rickenella mellea]